MSKYNKEPLDFVISAMTKDNSLSITAAAKLMCEEFNFEYKDSIRISISKLLKRRRNESPEAEIEAT